ncbi:unnamed protein product [Rhizoctonia solani]|uniref:Uncharacterized protein n=1 Tax=Rhizoctonia solani TaxID=456999 RepID=A0A8H3HKV3_9AGAM|nr:unnamed protein product [Rhizoctonia solani]
MAGQSSRRDPQDLFPRAQLRDPGMEALMQHQSTSSTPVPRADQSRTGQSSSAGPRDTHFTASHTPYQFYDSPGYSYDTTLPGSSSNANPNQPFEIPGANDHHGRSETSDSDTEMFDATSNIDGRSTPTQQFPENTETSNRFESQHLVDEHGSGGIVEKVVIDQLSLHRLLNIVQPGSYDSVSRINFKSLDQLSIRPVGVYGNRSEILKFLQQTRYLDENSTTLLAQAKSSDDSSPLRSGLYLALDPNHQDQGTSKAAYIIYWPEDTTWDDQAASSSVRRNRVTFMRYLNKLADQTIALVSPAQARALIWDTNAHNKDLPEDQQENDDDARLFDFEVSKSLEQEEDAIGSPGFTVYSLLATVRLRG